MRTSRVRLRMNVPKLVRTSSVRPSLAVVFSAPPTTVERVRCGSPTTTRWSHSSGVRNPRNKYARGNRSGARRAGRAPDRTSSDRARVCSSSSSSDRASRSWVRPHRASKRHSSRSRRSRGTRRPSARVSVPARLRSPRRHFAEPADEPLLVRLLADDARLQAPGEPARGTARRAAGGPCRSGTRPRAHRRAPHVWRPPQESAFFSALSAAQRKRNEMDSPSRALREKRFL